MITLIPGTRLDMDKRAYESAFSVISPTIEMTGGLALSQVCTLTGLEASTIQNWIKRRLVSSPVNKKYGRLHVARILILNLMRGILQLDQILMLMTYVNGSVDDRSDDIIDETALYDLLCKAIFSIEHERLYSDAEIASLTARLTEDYSGPFTDSRERLVNALEIMLRACIAAKYKTESENLFSKISDIKQSEEE